MALLFSAQDILQLLFFSKLQFCQFYRNRHTVLTHAQSVYVDLSHETVSISIIHTVIFLTVDSFAYPYGFHTPHF